MSRKIAGAALAAMVACGWTSGAEAAIYKFEAGSSLVNDDYVSILGYLDTTNNFAYAREDYLHCICGPNPNQLDTYVYRYLPFSIEFKPGNIEENEFISVKSQVFSFDFLQYNEGYSDLFNFSDPLFLSGPNTFSFETVDKIGPVPLPASAPLFGAALLALGGATYARRRMSKSRAA